MSNMFNLTVAAQLSLSRPPALSAEWVNPSVNCSSLLWLQLVPSGFCDAANASLECH